MDVKPIWQPDPVTISSREFNQNTARAKRIAASHPVFIKTRGEVSHVLLAKAAFDGLKARGAEAAEGSRRSLAEALAHHDGENIDFEAPEFKGAWKGFEFD